jgi:hypothetical protein
MLGRNLVTQKTIAKCRHVGKALRAAGFPRGDNGGLAVIAGRRGKVLIVKGG